MSAPPPQATIQLVQQDYAEIVAALRALNDSAGHERRTSPRIEVQAQVKIFPVVEGRIGPPFTCMTRDVSFRGVGLLQSKPSPQKAQFVIILPKQEGKPMPMLCVVMYSRELADGLFNIGASFVRQFDFDKPHGAPATPGTAAGTTAPAATQTAKPATPADPEAELKRIRQSILD